MCLNVGEEPIPQETQTENTVKLFIANCTRSRFIFHASIEKGSKARRLDIASGHQEIFPGDLNQEQLAYVVTQLERYGGRKRADIRGKLEKFTGIAYSLDKPLSEDEIIAGNEAQLDAAQNRSVAQATNSALAAERAFRDPKTPKKRSVKTVGVEVLKKTDARGDEVPMMNIEITENGSTSAKLPV